MKLKVTTLNNLIEILSLMAAAFGSKELAAKHRNALETYVLNIDYEKELAFNTSQIVGDVGQFDYTTFENFVLT